MLWYNSRQRRNKVKLEEYDAIVVHTCKKFKYRHEPLKAELKRIGILDRVKFQMIDTSLHDNVRLSLQYFLDSYWNNALFLEDDIRFLKDVDRVREIFANSPDERDICSFDNFIHHPQGDLEKIRKIDGWFEYNPRVYGTSCWSVNNREAAEILAHSYDRHPNEPPDKPCFTCHTDLKNTFHSRGVCIQLCYADSSNVVHGWQNIHHGGYFGLDYRDYNVPDDYVFGSIVKP